jgi:Ala-tRNA(Pro) deacylase
MAAAIDRLISHLDSQGAKYERVHHRRDFTARQTAVDTSTPEAEFAKTVFVRIDGRDAMAVLPASRFVDAMKLADSVGAREVLFADEDAIEELCPDCEIGAAPPFGNLYGLAVYASRELAEDARIAFNAGSHEEVLRISWHDFERCVEPEVIALSESD